jgi:hypothetical protein
MDDDLEDLEEHEPSKFKADEDKVISKAIPSAIRVKDEILDTRSLAIKSYSNMVYRASVGKDVTDEIAQLQGYLSGLFKLLELKFAAKSKDLTTLKQLDDLLDTGKILPAKTLREALNILNRKVEDLGITKIEKKHFSEDESMA